MTVPTPILDTGHRVARTVVQVLLAFGSFAALYPLLVDAIGAPTGSRTAVWLATGGVYVAAAAGIISRLMAIPAINAAIAPLRLDAAPPVPAAEPSTWTTVVTAANRDTGEFTGEPAY